MKRCVDKCVKYCKYVNFTVHTEEYNVVKVFYLYQCMQLIKVIDKEMDLNKGQYNLFKLYQNEV